MKILALFLLVLISSAKAQNTDEIKLPLIGFLRKLSPNNPNINGDLNWTADSDPCLDEWIGISCSNNRSPSLQSIILESLDLSGSIDGNLLSLLCNSSSLSVLNLNSNSLAGNLPPEISHCPQLTKLFLGNNRLSGTLPSSLPDLRNLKMLDVSHNSFSGELPWNLSNISGLHTFLADNNRFAGAIPDFDLNYFSKFNVSFNRLSGSVPSNSAKFPLSSFSGNVGLCGKPVEIACAPPSSSMAELKKSSVNKVVLISGYVLFALALALLLIYCQRKKKKKGGITSMAESSGRKLLNSERMKSSPRREYSISSSQSAAGGSSACMVVLCRDEGGKDLRFEELLRAPAELMKRGNFASLYKVVINGGETELVVKRIRDSMVTGEEFQKKIMRLDLARHPNVLPVVALYSSKQEKLVVYEYQKNGSLFKLLHESRDHAALKWAPRLNIAAGVSAGLSYMHQTLPINATSGGGGAAGHGNLKASNILFSSAMEPLVSEYGLTALPISHCQLDSAAAAADVYALGVIFLELLTGRPSRGFDLARWVHSAVREEWTAEVFDRNLLAGDEDGKAEEAMVRLLQVALRCISPESRRPTMAEVAAMVEALM